MTEHTWQETIKGEAGHLVKKVEEMIAEGNVRKIRITHEGRTIAEFPLTVGVVGGVVGLVFAPVIAAVGAIAAVATDCEIHVERVEKKPN
jgi:Domain of unknown function (DUF4342)